MRTRLTLLVLALISAGAATPGAVSPRQAPHESELSVKITSPLGRSGILEKVRIVALIEHPDGRRLEPVKFFADGTLVGTDGDGPPYAVEWSDENPFEAREISVEVTDNLGTVARDRVHLEPLTVAEAADVASVLLDVTVHDRAGRVIRGLGRDDFRLLEDGVPQTLDQVQSDRGGATFTLLIDSSQSMARNIDSVRSAAAVFVRSLRPDDRVLVVPFSKTLGAVTGPTADLQTVGDAIATIRSQGGTAILDTIKTVAERLATDATRQAIVLLTDGYDEHSTIPRDEALAAIKRLRAPLYVIGIAGSAGISLKGERFLRALAEDTGGRAFFPSRDSQYATFNQRVAEEVQHRYLIAYTPANQRIDGSWRQIALSTSNPDWIARSRPGYFAPKPPPIRTSIEFALTNTRRELLAVAAEELAVREDGVDQTIEAFEEAVAPVWMVLALDSSGSMKKQAAEAQAAARSFVNAIRPEDNLTVSTFGETVSFPHGFTTRRADSLAAIDAYRAIGGTPLYDSLHESFSRLAGVAGRRVVVVVSDGRDENNAGTGPGSEHQFDDVLALMKQAEVTVFAIGLGPKVDRLVMERLAVESGGEAYFPADVSELDAQYHRVVENLRRRYVITYTSTNPKRDGGWRAVEIVSKTPGTTVISKGGYFAPGDVAAAPQRQR